MALRRGVYEAVAAHGNPGESQAREGLGFEPSRQRIALLHVPNGGRLEDFEGVGDAPRFTGK